MAAQPTDILSIDDALVAVRKPRDHTQHVARLEAYVSAVSQLIDELVGPVVCRTITGEQVEVCRYGDGVRLRRRPVTSITTVKVWNQGVGTTLIEASLSVQGGFLAEKDPDDPNLLSGWLNPRSGWGAGFWDGQTVEVTYEAGRFADTAAAKNSRFFKAAELALKSVFRVEENTVQSGDDFFEPGSVVPGFFLPNAAKELLAADIQYSGIA